MRRAVEQIMADPSYLKNIEYGEPRSGHPEGQVKSHIAELEGNLGILAAHGISCTDYWKLKFLIHVHDTFKAEAKPDVPILHPQSHASLARAFAAQFTEDTDLLSMIQFHDENYYLWKEKMRTGTYDSERFQVLLNTICNWDLFLMFIIIDGCTAGKEREKLEWFIREVKRHKQTLVEPSWVGRIP